MKYLYVVLTALTALSHPSVSFTQITDTFLLRGCAGFWATGHPVNNIQLSVSIDYANPIQPDQMYQGNPDTASACGEVSFVSTPLSSDVGIWVSAEKPYTVNDYANGVSVCDLIAIQKHILGLEPLSPYALLAADANRSHAITGFDIVELRKLLLGIYTELPNAPSWQILSPNCTFSNPQNPFNAVCVPFPGNTLPDLANMDFNLKAVKTGDVTGDYAFEGKYQQTPSLNALDLYLPNQNLKAGETIALPLFHKGKYPMVGLQFELRYDTTALAIQKVTDELGSNLYNWAIYNNEGRLRSVSYYVGQPIPDTLAYLQFLVKTSGPLAGLIAIDTLRFAPLYSINCNAYGKIGLQFETLSGFNPPVEVPWIGPASPNPFVDQTAILVTLDRPSLVQLEVLDLTGRLTYGAVRELPAGVHALEIPAKAVSAASTGIYRVTAGRNSFTGKILRL